MIPVTPQPEPQDFDENVREPGIKFLQQVPKPTSEQWKRHAYWQNILPEMRTVYKKTCAYCAQWIPHGTGNHSVDHFLPKDEDKYSHLAYEWANFRYASARFNSRKHKGTILDPFKIKYGWFILDFPSCMIRPNPKCRADNRKKIQDTIDALHLNDDEDLVNERCDWFNALRNGEIRFSRFKELFPFIAYELERQGLVDQTGA